MVQKILFKWKLYCILKNDLAFHQVKEELWNLGNMLLGVLQSLEYFFLSKYPEMRPIIPLLHFLSEAASVFQKYVFSICLSWFSSTTTYKFTKCLHLNDFETPKCEILSLTFEALSLPTKYIKLNFWMLQSLLRVKTGN